MSLKERLFGPAWESKNPSARRQAVGTASDPRLRERLPGIAAEDADPGVRLAALQRLGEERQWLRAAADDPDADNRAAADRAVARSIASSEAANAQALQARTAWLAAKTDTELLRRIARDAVDTALRESALERITAPGFLGDCVVGEADEGLAGRTLARIDQVSTLRRIAAALRTRNKKRHHLALQRLAELEHGQPRHDATDELARGLIERVEQIARGESSGDRAATLERLEREWRALDPDDAALERRFSGALGIARAALRPRERAEAPTPEAPSDPPSGDAGLESLIEEARTLAERPDNDRTAAAVSDLISRFDRRWNEIGRRGEPEQRQRKHFDALAGELQARLQAWQKARTPQTTPGTDGQSRREHSDDGDLSALTQALENAESVLESGDIRKADEAIRAARARVDGLSAKRRPGDVRSRLGRMAARLKEMRDWQHWSNNKLRERLIERAGEIDADALHPDAVTARLKELRQRWKDLDELELLPGDKRRFAAPQGQWRRFQRACKEAFEAAKPRLEQRSEVREQSLAELQEFLEKARGVVADADTPSDRLVRYQRAARQAIRNLDALPPARRGKSAAALRELMDAISAALDQRFEAAETTKRKLVAEARKLAHATDRTEAVERAKALQAEWKRAGRGRKKVEDELWREFREPIDPLFEDLKQERDQQRRVEHEHIESLNALCQRAEQLAAADDPDAARGPLAGLEDEFAAFERVPAAVNARFERALARHRERVARRRTERAERRNQHLQALAESLQQAWEDIHERGRTDQQALSAEPYQDDASASALAARLEELTRGDASPEELGTRIDSSTADARQVVIEMECLSGVETPEHDHAQRMDFQVARLSTRLGEGAPRPDLATERAGLHRRWWESFPHDPADHAELARRFQAADQILSRMMAS